MSKAPTTDPIRPDETYSLAAAKPRTGWGDAAIRKARRAGLRMLYLHGRVFIRGSDLIAYITKNAATEPPTAGKQGDQ